MALDISADDFAKVDDGRLPFVFCADASGTSAVRRSVDLCHDKLAVFPGSFNPLHAGHRGMAQFVQQLLNSVVVFEMSVQNVDKASLSLDEVRHRLRRFNPGDLVVLTRAARFLEKAKLFRDKPFVAGIDTIMRIANPRYYGNDVELRNEAIRQLEDYGTRFVVFGRLVGKEFLDGERIKLPTRLKQLCEFVSEDDFREDVSSTLLRNQNLDQP